MPERNVLFVSYPYPPNAAVGTQRVVKFCRYLPDHGWRPTVVTCSAPPRFQVDETLLDEVRHVRVYRAAEPRYQRRRRAEAEGGDAGSDEPRGKRAPRRFELPRRLVRNLASLPDVHSSWIPFAVGTGIRAVTETEPEVVLSSSPPPSGHLAATLIAKLAGLPLVIDFRDPWTDNEGYGLRGLPMWYRALDRRIESWVLRRASRVVTASPGFTRLFARRLGPTGESRCSTITNGLDPADFARLPAPSAGREESFTIVHLGSLYGQRDPLFFLQALDAWRAAHPAEFSRVRVRFVGESGGHAAKVRDTPLAATVSFEPHRPRREALELLTRADLLLLVLGFSSVSKSVIPAKLFEYVASGVPIFALAPRGEASAMVERHEAGEVLSEPDVGAAVAALRRRFDRWSSGGGSAPGAWNIPESLDRRKLTGDLARVLSEAASETPPS